MARTFALALGLAALLSGPASATCARMGSQVSCRWSGVFLTLGTQAEPGGSASGLSRYSQGFAGPTNLGRRSPPPGTLVLSLQSFGNDPHSCGRLGNEAYCW